MNGITGKSRVLTRTGRAMPLMIAGICILLLTTGIRQTASAQSYSMKELVTIHVSQSNVAAILEELDKQSNYSFTYSRAALQKIETGSIDWNKVTLETALNELKKKYHIGFQPVNTTISFYQEKASPDKGDTLTKHVTPAKLIVTGQVKDGATKKPLPGVDVMVQGSRMNTVTAADGTYEVLVKDSSAVLVFSIVGYESRFISAGKQEAVVFLAADDKALTGVVVGARRKINTEVALLNERKNAAIVSDGISAQQMERTASITTTQALQRVSGVTITDDKYVAIRGLGDRSVIGQLNGVRLASSDPDRSTIPLDLVPASLLDNITIYKTVAPDKPADAAAGIVELKTKSIPERQTLSITAQVGMNTQTGGKVNSFYNSDMGFLGNKVKNKDLSADFHNLATQYPNGLGDIQAKIANSRNNPALLAEANRVNGIMHQLDPVMTTRYKTAPVNQVYSVTYGNSLKVFKNHQLGIIAGVNYYSRTTDIYQGELTQWSLYQGALTGNSAIYNPLVIPSYVTPNNINLGKYLGYKENTGTQTLNYGFLAGLAYRFNPQHEISLQYLGSRGAETKATHLAGAYEYIALPGGIASTQYSLRQTQRSLNTFNLQGEHKFSKGNLTPRLSYNLASSNSSQNDPDFRFANLADYQPTGGGTYGVPVPGQPDKIVASEHLYSLVSGYVNGYGPYGIIQADPNGRRFRKLNEDNYNYKADVTVPFKTGKLRQEFKTGVNYLHRKRSYSENVLYLPGSNYSNTGALPLYAVNGNLDRLVGYDRIGIALPSTYNEEGAPRVGGYLYNTQKSPNNYKGYFETRAFYGMMDMHLTEKLRLTGGVRFEMTDIKAAVDTSNVFLDASVTTVDGAGNKVNLVYTEPNSVYKVDYEPFYSANLTYTLNSNMNFRLGYNNSLARPELRELTNVFDFDPFQFALVVGNPNLKNQKTTNYDFRWEWFPAPGEVLAVSAFYKEIENQLTKVFKQNSTGLNARFPEFPAIEFQNDPNKGKVYGIELEVVKNLGLLTPALRNFFLGSNLLLAQSDIKKTAERLASSRAIDRRSPSNSPLFEQAPYSVNVYLNYGNRKAGTDITATFNMVGERLIQVNLDGTPDLYSRPQPVLDLVFTQQLFKRIQLKGFAKNILDKPYQEVYANPGTGGKFYGKQYTRRSYNRGTEIMLGLTYSL